MLRNIAIFCATILFSTSLTKAEGLRVLATLPVTSQEKNSSVPESADYASWIDPDSIIYCTQKGRLACRAVGEKDDSWSKEGNYNPRQICVDLVGKRIAISCSQIDSDEVFRSESIFRVYDSRSGKIVF